MLRPRSSPVRPFRQDIFETDGRDSNSFYANQGRLIRQAARTVTDFRRGVVRRPRVRDRTGHPRRARPPDGPDERYAQADFFLRRTAPAAATPAIPTPNRTSDDGSGTAVKIA